MKETKKDPRESLLFIAWAASVIAMFGSLFFRKSGNYEPCDLCWYQRILMYPYVILLGMAVVKKGFQNRSFIQWFYPLLEEVFLSITIYCKK